MEQTAQLMNKIEEINRVIKIIRIEVEELKEGLLYPPEGEIREEFIEEVEKKEKEGKFSVYQDINQFFSKIEKDV